jgi:hypothetical protein
MWSDESCGRRPAGPLSSGSRLSSLNQAAAVQQDRSKPEALTACLGGSPPTLRAGGDIVPRPNKYRPATC